ncbi:MAG: hypothetical protein AB7O97_00445 [Planctomycetota bacterium]
MRTIPLAAALLFLPHASGVQDPAPAAGPRPAASFATAVERAQQAFAAGLHGETVAALQAAILAVQQLQRAAILAALPAPAGFAIDDVAPRRDEADPFAAGIQSLGLDVERRCRRGEETRLDFEVSTNSPLAHVFARQLETPDALTGKGLALQAFGAHRGVLDSRDDERHELTVVLIGRHVLKVTADHLPRAELLGIVDRAFIERLAEILAR